MTSIIHPLMLTAALSMLLAPPLAQAQHDPGMPPAETASANSAPEAYDSSLTVASDATHSFAKDDFRHQDPDNTNQYIHIIIATLPIHGSLTDTGNAVVPGQEFSTDDMDDLVYAPPAHGTVRDSLTFRVRDDKGATSNTATLSIAIEASASGPSGASGVTQTSATGTPTVTASDNTDLEEDGPTENSTLTASTAGIDEPNGIDTSTLSWQWQLADAQTPDTVPAPNTFTDMASATDATFTPLQAHVGKYLRVCASFRDSFDPPADEGPLCWTSAAAVRPVNHPPTGRPEFLERAMARNASHLTLDMPYTIEIDVVMDANGREHGERIISIQRSDGTTGSWTQIGEGTIYTPTLEHLGGQVRSCLFYIDDAGYKEGGPSDTEAERANGTLCSDVLPVVTDRIVGKPTVTATDDADLAADGPNEDIQLTATTEGIHTPEGTDDPTWQWQQSADGNTFTNITDATSETFTPRQAHVGSHLKVCAIYQDSTAADEAPCRSTAAVRNVNDLPTGKPTFANRASHSELEYGLGYRIGIAERGATVKDEDGLPGDSVRDRRDSSKTSFQSADSASGIWTEVHHGYDFDTNIHHVSRADLEAGFLRVCISYTDLHGTKEGGSFSTRAERINGTLCSDVAQIRSPAPMRSSISLPANKAHAFSVSDFNYIDKGDDALTTITISGLLLYAGRGTLTLSGTAVTAEQTITADNIPNLVYAPAAGAGATSNYNRFAFMVDDGNGLASTRSAYMWISLSDPEPTSATGMPTITAADGTNLGMRAPEEDSQMTATTEGITDPDGIDDTTLRWQWQQGPDASGPFTNIADATDAAFTPDQPQVDSYLRVCVRFQDHFDPPTDEGPLCTTTAAVDNIPDPAMGSPTVSGTLETGHTLSATSDGITDEDGLPGADGFSWQWQQSDNTGGPFTNIAGATDKTLPLEQQHANKYIRVCASFTDDHGSDEMRCHTSAKVVNAPPTGRPEFLERAMARNASHLTLDMPYTIEIDVVMDANGREHGERLVSIQRSDGTTGTWTQIGEGTIYTPTQEHLGGQVRACLFYIDDAGYAEGGPSDTEAKRANGTLCSDVLPVVTDRIVGKPTVTATDDANLAADGPNEDIVLTATTENIHLPAHITDSTPSWKWQQSTDNTTFTDITGATSETFKPLQAHVGSYLRVCATYTGSMAADEAPCRSTAAVRNVNDLPTGMPTIVSLGVSLSELEFGRRYDIGITDHGANVKDEDGLPGDNESEIQSSSTISFQSGEDGSWTEVHDDESPLRYWLTREEDLKAGFLRVCIFYTDLHGTAEGGPSATKAERTNGTLCSDAVPIRSPVPDTSNISLPANKTHTFSVSDFGYIDTQNDPMTAITIHSLPSKGTLTLSGTAVTAEQTITADNIPSLVYAPETGADATQNYTIFAFMVDDGNGFASTRSGYMGIHLSAGVPTPPIGGPNIKAADGTNLGMRAPEEDSQLTATTEGIIDPDGIDDTTLKWQWQQGPDASGPFTDMAGATNAAFTPDQDQVDNYLRVCVRFQDHFDPPTDEGPLCTTTTETVDNINDEATGNPEISGTLATGETLSATTGDIADEDGLPEPPAFNWKWQQGDATAGPFTDIATATAATDTTLLLGQEHGNKYIKVCASFTDDHGGAEEQCHTSDNVVNAPPTGKPVFRERTMARNASHLTLDMEHSIHLNGIMDANGREHGGRIISIQRSDGTTGTWTQIGEGTIYTPTMEHLGGQVRACLFYIDDAGYKEGGPSDTEAERANGTLCSDSLAVVPPTIMGTPTLSATDNANLAADGPNEDIVLTATTENIHLPAHITSNTPSWKWQQSEDNATFTDIAGATSETFTPLQEHVGSYIKVCAIYQDSTAADETVCSESTAAVRNDNDLPTSRPTITGMPADGPIEDGTLTATTDGITDPDGINTSTLSWQWQQGTDASGPFTDIAGATNEEFIPLQIHVDKYLQVCASFQDNFSTDEGPLCAIAEKKVANIPDPSTGSPEISGTLAVGSTLSATRGNIADEDGLPEPPAFNWQWQQGDTTAGPFTDIATATATTDTTLLLGQQHANKYIRVCASFTDNHGGAEEQCHTSDNVVNAPPTGRPVFRERTMARTVSHLTLDMEHSIHLNGIMDANGREHGERLVSIQRSDGTTGSWAQIGEGTIYTPTLEHLGGQVRACLFYTDDAGYAEGGTSEPEAERANGTLCSVGLAVVPPNIMGTPTLSATDNANLAADGPNEDIVLTATTENIHLPAHITDNDPSWQWQQSTDNATFTDIAGATSAAFKPLQAHVGSYLKVCATYTGNMAADETVCSESTAAVRNHGEPPTGRPAFVSDSTSRTVLEYDQEYSVGITDHGGTVEDEDGLPDGRNGSSKTSFQSAESASGPWTEVHDGGNWNTDSYRVSLEDLKDGFLRVCIFYIDLYGTAEGGPSATPAERAIGTLCSEGLAVTAPTITGTLTISAADGTDLTEAGPNEDSVLTADAENIYTPAHIIDKTPSWRWQQSTDNTTFTDIAGATSASFKPLQEHVGSYLKVCATYTGSMAADETPCWSSVDTVQNVNDLPTGRPTIVANKKSHTEVGYGEHYRPGIASYGAMMADEDGLPGDSEYERRNNSKTSFQTVSNVNDPWTEVHFGEDWSTGVHWVSQADLEAGFLRICIAYTDLKGTAEGGPFSTPAERINGTLCSDAAQIRSPVPVASSITLPANKTHKFSVDNFNFRDAEDDALTSITISELPSQGTLTLDATAVSRNQIIPAASIGTLVYKPPEDASSATYNYYNYAYNYTSFSFMVDDGNGMASTQSADMRITLSAPTQTPATGAPTITAADDTDLNMYGPNEGSTLTATTDGITDPDGINTDTLSWQWKQAASANGTFTDIAGATNAEFIPLQAHVGKYLRVCASFQDNFGPPTDEGPLCWTSTYTVHNINDLAIGTPAVSGSRIAGSTLTASKGSIFDEDGITNITLEWQWQQGDSAEDTFTDIVGATSRSYTLSQSQVGKYIRVCASFNDQLDPSVREGPLCSDANIVRASRPTVSVSMQTGTTYTFRGADFTDSSATWDNIIIDSLPGRGTLTFNGSSIIAGQTISSSQARSLVYTPPTGTTVSSRRLYTNFNFTGTSQVDPQACYTSEGPMFLGAPDDTCPPFSTPVPPTTVSTAYTMAIYLVPPPPPPPPPPMATGMPDVTSLLDEGRDHSIIENFQIYAHISPAITSPNGIDSSSVRWRWQSAANRSGPYSNIAGATTSSFTPRQDQVGRFLRVCVWFNDNLNPPVAHGPLCWTSDATVAEDNICAPDDDSPLSRLPRRPGAVLGCDLSTITTNTPAAGTPTVSATDGTDLSASGPKTGTVLVASARGLHDDDGIDQSTLEWQWQLAAADDGVPADDAYSDIAGAKGPEFTPTDAMIGQYLRLCASFQDQGTPVAAEGPLCWTSAAPIVDGNLPPTTHSVHHATRDQLILIPEHFPFMDDNEGDLLRTVHIASLPDASSATMTLDGEPIGAGKVLSVIHPHDDSFDAEDADSQNPDKADDQTSTTATDQPRFAEGELAITLADDARLARFDFKVGDGKLSSDAATFKVELGADVAAQQVAQMAAAISGEILNDAETVISAQLDTSPTGQGFKAFAQLLQLYDGLRASPSDNSTASAINNTGASSSIMGSSAATGISHNSLSELPSTLSTAHRQQWYLGTYALADSHSAYHSRGDGAEQLLSRLRSAKDSLQMSWRGSGRAQSLGLWARYHSTDMQGISQDLAMPSSQLSNAQTVAADSLAWNGSGQRLYLGIEHAHSAGLRTGLALGLDGAHLHADMEQDGQSDAMERSTTGIYPYLNWQLGDGNQLRIISGYGSGHLSLHSTINQAAATAPLQWRIMSASISRQTNRQGLLQGTLSANARHSSATIGRASFANKPTQLQGATHAGGQAGLDARLTYNGSWQPFMEASATQAFGDLSRPLAYHLKTGITRNRGPVQLRISHSHQLGNAAYRQDSSTLNLSLRPAANITAAMDGKWDSRSGHTASARLEYGFHRADATLSLRTSRNATGGSWTLEGRWRW